MSELLDARGVIIAPGDTAIYGFGVDRSIAIAEAVVLGDHHLVKNNPKRVTDKFTTYDTDCACGHKGWPCPSKSSVSLTPSGRVRVKVIRRSYSDGVKPVVDVAADRLVVLKPDGALDNACTDFLLPPSPLPTQADEARADTLKQIEGATRALRSEEAPDYWAMPGETPEGALVRYYAFYARQLARCRSVLKTLDDDE